MSRRRRLLLLLLVMMMMGRMGGLPDAAALRSAYTYVILLGGSSV